jgi:hypothetical protein
MRTSLIAESDVAHQHTKDTLSHEAVVSLEVCIILRGSLRESEDERKSVQFYEENQALKVEVISVHGVSIL